MEIKFPYQCFINNEFSDAVEGNTFTTINPTTEEPIATIAASGVAEVERAVAAAKVSNNYGNLSIVVTLYNTARLMGPKSP